MCGHKKKMSSSPKVGGCMDKERGINLVDGLHLRELCSGLGSRLLSSVDSLQESFPSKLLAFPGFDVHPVPTLQGWLFLSQIVLCGEHSFWVSPVILQVAVGTILEASSATTEAWDSPRGWQWWGLHVCFCYRVQAHFACHTVGQWIWEMRCWGKEYNVTQKAGWLSGWQTNVSK